MKKRTERAVFVTILVMALVLVWVIKAHALDFASNPKFGVKDLQMYVRDVSGTTPQNFAGTGLSYGPIYTVSSKGQWVADLVSVCGVAAANTGSQGGFSGDLGICPINLMGLQTGIFYDPHRDRMTWGIGLSLTGFVNQLTK